MADVSSDQLYRRSYSHDSRNYVHSAGSFGSVAAIGAEIAVREHEVGLHSIAETGDSGTNFDRLGTKRLWERNIPFAVPLLSRLVYGPPMSELLARITTRPEQSRDQPCTRGVRIRVIDVLEMFAGSMMHAEILADYPHLVEDDIRASLAYAAREMNHPVVTAAERSFSSSSTARRK